MLHQARAALFAHLLGQRAGQFVGASRPRPANRRRRRRGRAAAASRNSSSSSNSASVSPGKPVMKVRANRQVRAPRGARRRCARASSRRRRPLHQLEDARAGVLERHVEVGQDLAFGHQRQQVVDVRIRIDVVQAHPDAEFAERLAQVEQLGLHRPAAPEAGAVLDVDAVGAGVLRDDQQFLDAGLDQRLRLRASPRRSAG